MITIIGRTLIDPLSGKAAASFAINNFNYFGLPIELIFLAFFNTTIALVIWIFGKYGLFPGVFASVASSSGMFCVLVAVYSFFQWKNKELPESVRSKRKELGEKILKKVFFPVRNKKWPRKWLDLVDFLINKATA